MSVNVPALNADSISAAPSVVTVTTVVTGTSAAPSSGITEISVAGGGVLAGFPGNVRALISARLENPSASESASSRRPLNVWFPKAASAKSDPKLFLE